MCFASQLFSTAQLPQDRPFFYTFHFEMCFAPQRRALFQLPKMLRTWGPLCAFWLRHVLRATTACNFSSLIWPDGSAPAALASLLFDRLEPQNIGKTQCFATFLPFRALASSLFWLFLFSDLLLLFSSLILLTSAFSSVHIVGSLTSNFLRIYTMCIRHIYYVYIYIYIYEYMPAQYNCASEPELFNK